MSQREIFHEKLNNYREVKCECIKQGVVVILQKSFDPRYYFGNCGKCGKQYVIKEGQAHG